MKNYIAPIARNINIEMEAIIALSNVDAEGNGVADSNRRGLSASEAIWGLSDETSIDE